MVKPTGFDCVRNLISALSGNFDPPEYDLILGPCAIESERQLEICASAASEVGATYLRGGAIKLRTRAESFHGHGWNAYRWLGEIARDHDLKAISEVTCTKDVVQAAPHLHALQIGARSMWNFELLKAAAQSGHTVVLKRGLGASTMDWLSTAARLQSYGAKSVVLCERGNSSADPASRNCVDLSVLAFLAAEAPLPLWLDVSHSSGDPDVALWMLNRAPAFGLHGAMAEIHPNPNVAMCDAEQAIPINSLLKSGLKREAPTFPGWLAN